MEPVRSHKRVGLKLSMALAAVLAFAAVAAGSASAAEFEPEGGSFPVGFTSTSGEGTLETSSGETVTCTADSNTGSITGPNSATVTVHFTGCTTTFFGFPISCHTPGASSGEIVTAELAGDLGENAAGTKALMDLEGPGGEAAEFECAGNTVVVTGSVIGEFPETNEFLHQTSMVLTQSGGVQGIKQYVNSSGETVENFLSSSKNGETPVESGEETTDVITLEGTEKVDIVL